jgi:RNA polymerase sigma-70 factor (ECF subfamily)
MHNPTPENQRLVTLLNRVALHDHAAFEELYQLTSAHLFGVAVRLMRKREAAEEILQDAFINVWQQAGRYAAGLSSPMTWLIFIVRNKALDRLRSGKRECDHTVPDTPECESESAPHEGIDHADPESLFVAATDKMMLNRCMGELDPAQRQSLALAYYDGLSHSELAAHLQVPLGTAKAWVRRGLDRLRKCLEAASYSAAA